MAGLVISANFDLKNKTMLDSRQKFTTIYEMASFNENIIPNGLLAFNEEDSSYYQFLDLNEVDVTLGKWRKFTSGGGADIDDTLETSTTKTYSIDKIKELLKTKIGLLAVDVLPDLTNPTVQATIEEDKIYLVPNPNPSPDKHDEKLEYACIHIKAKPPIMREPKVTLESDWDDWKAEIEDYRLSGGTADDDFATYSGVKTTTTMTSETYAEMVESLGANDTDYNAYVARVEAIELVPATSESWGWELLGTLGGASLVFDDFTPNNEIGKIKAGVSLLDKDVISVLKDMLTVPVATTIKLVGEQSTTTLYEKGATKFDSVRLTATIDLGTGVIEDGANIIFKRDGVVINTQTYTGGTLTYIHINGAPGVEDTTKYSVEVEYTMDGETKTAKSEITYNFAYPMFYGTSTTKTISSVPSLTKIVSSAKTQTLTYTTNNSYCVFAIPDTLTLKSLKDSNNFENLTAWSNTTQSVTIGTEQVVYRVFIANDKTTMSLFRYIATLQ